MAQVAGTKDMCKQAETAGIKVVVPLDQEPRWNRSGGTAHARLILRQSVVRSPGR
jgi:hypothetical protein